ncbi:MAG TPA: M48 family metallopeptidase [Burkholderiaceae bacterium]|nr:M48 family metallopeptidase [Burkholderiaceae bacterium]HQR69540.1 M48 family metallopeptidase [Burkholderiaceae bacterium]
MSQILSLAFVGFLLLMVGLKYWLAWRQVRHVSRHADSVPRQFAGRVPLEAHRKAASYTIARTRLALVETAVGAAVLIVLTLLGGLQSLADALRAAAGTGFAFQLLFVISVAILLGLIDLPFSWVRQFRVEAHYGFNRMTPRLWFADLAKSFVLAALLGVPLLAAVVALMRGAGELWWIYAWLLWVGFNALVLVIYPTVIAPLFNRFEPLKDSALAQRIGELLSRTGFSSKGVFVMDGSRRSAHGNAYFTGLGRAKRIVFFDTLVDRLQPSEIEAVLAHELGHFKLKHIAKRMAFSFVASLVFLALLGWLVDQSWFYTGLGVTPSLDGGNEGIALVLFVLVLPVFTFVFAPLASYLSRRHEFEADAFAARHASADDLVNALVKLYEDNAATLTPDPIHSAFYDSHPPASLRVARLAAAAAT